MAIVHDDITSILKEKRVFKPAKGFSEEAYIGSVDGYLKLRDDAEKDPEQFWHKAAEQLQWHAPWQKVLEWNTPDAKWFVGGRLNVSINCVDRHAQGPNRSKAAILWEGEPGDERVLTYEELQSQVCQFANVLKELRVCVGDRVCLYMPMVPELAIAMLACARIGAIHSVVFGGFSSQALIDRINDAQAKVVVTADGGYRRGGIVPLKATVDQAMAHCPVVENVVVYQRTHSEVSMKLGRDSWWHELMQKAPSQCDAELVDAEHPLFILYTSGSTGKPKGVLHTTGGYLTQVALTTAWIFDLKPSDIYWCTADIGWITGHSYIVYGPLANGTTVFMYEGAPNHPAPDRFWSMVEKYKISIFYTAPTAIRAFMKYGDEWPKKRDLSSLRLLGTVGEPINPEAWIWYYEHIGGKRCPIVDTWWQTETGAILISPLPGVTSTKPGSATHAFPGIAADVVNMEGKSLASDQGGYLVIRRPWPSMMRTIYGDHERFKRQYWSQIPGCYFTGDGARKDSEGYFWLMGRIDDVIKVSGHRLGTAEIESALVAHEAVAEAAVVSRADDLTGEAVVAFVTLASHRRPSEPLRKELMDHVTNTIGAIARPKDLRFTDSLPKTRSGKIMRRLLRDVASGQESKGDTTTLEDLSVLAKLREKEGD